jgi:hypothetical protein
VNPYRHADEAHLSARRSALLRARRLEGAALIAADDPAATVYACRFARSVFGLAGLGMAAVLVRAALSSDVPLVPILDASWLIIGVVVLASRPLAQMALRDGLRTKFMPTDDLVADLELLETKTAERAAAELADELEVRSVALPLAALALLLPLTLHRLGAFLLGQIGVHMPFVGLFAPLSPLDAWIKASMVMVGHCHLLLVILATAFARDLRRHPDFPEHALGERAGWAAFAWTSLASVPAALVCLAVWPLEGWMPFLLIPTLVTLTGLTFIPPSFLALGRAVARERSLIRC